MGLIATPFTRILESLTSRYPVFLLRLVHEAVRQDPIFSRKGDGVLVFGGKKSRIIPSFVIYEIFYIYEP